MKNLKYCLLTVIAGLLVSCGGSSSEPSPDPGTQNPPPPVGGVVRSGIAYGPISGFGSVIVNGVHYDTNGAIFSIDDSTGSESDLKVGQVVTMKTETDDQGNASATDVIFDDEVQGPIDSIDLINSTIVVLGQMVLINANTSFDDSFTLANIDGLMVGDVVEVSGLVNADGVIVASRIEPKLATDEFEVHGTITILDSGAQTFMLNELLVDYSTATLEDFGSATPTEGDLVEVKGTSFNANSALIATKIELETINDRIGDNDDDAEIEGLITEFTSAQSFSVAGVPVITNSGTEYKYGAASNLALNVRIEVDGVFNASGVLVADEVEFENESDVEVVSVLDSVDSTNQTITIFGITFLVDASTRFEDKSDADLEPFNFSHLSAGDYLAVRGFTREGDGLYASLIEREDIDTRNEVQGMVETIATDSLSILGVTITIDANTEYQDFDDSTMTQSEFFGLLSVGSLVNARGSKTSSNVMLAEQLSFEN